MARLAARRREMETMMPKMPSSARCYRRLFCTRRHARLGVRQYFEACSLLVGGVKREYAELTFS